MSQSPQETAAPPAKVRKKAPIFLAAGIVLLLGGVGVVKLATGKEAVAESGAADDHGPAHRGETTVITLAPFILNLADQEDERYLRVSLAIVLAGLDQVEAESDEGPEHARLRDRILTVLGTKSAEEVTSFEGKESLRAELKRHVAELLADRQVVDVLFTEFLVQ